MRVLATHSIRQFPLHFPSHASPCATRFRTSSTLHQISFGEIKKKEMLICEHNIKTVLQEVELGHELD